MEFDKSKILTVATADQLKHGQMGWVENDMAHLMDSVKICKPCHVFKNEMDNNLEYPFIANVVPKRYFYPEQVLPYEERQAIWAKQNGVKAGTRVRFIKNFNADIDGSHCCEHLDAMGKTGVITGSNLTSSVEVLVEGVSYHSWSVPYTALEVIKEPTYRPYNNDELNDLVGEVLTNKQNGRRKLVTGKPTAAEGVNLDGSYINAKDLLASFYRNRDEPCGVKE